MIEIRLLLDLNSEADNLYIETGHNCRIMYGINGFASYDGDVDSFSDEPKARKIKAGGKNIIGSISQIDVDYMLTFNIVVFEADRVYLYIFKSDKLRNLDEVAKKLYEVPESDLVAVEPDEAAEFLAEEFYVVTHEDSQFEFPLNISLLYKFLYAEKEKLYRSNILTNKEYEGFIEDVYQFAEKYKVEFAQSEGTDRVVSTIYLMREYLNQDWTQIYGLLKRI